MSTETNVSIYYGPLDWFRQQLIEGGVHDVKNVIDLVHEWDDYRSTVRMVHTTPDHEDVEVAKLPPMPATVHVAAESRDYASVRGHVMTNFLGFIRSTGPEHLYLQNPPAQVREQLERALPSTQIHRYTYPAVKVETLRRFRDEYATRIVGQHRVATKVLSALYPLTQDGHDRPVAIMFYGPSGVGKTQTAQLLNELLGGELMRKQFSMFHNDTFASYVFGGDHSDACLARDLLDRSSGVVLIDEFDKANPVFHSAFYELFDGGRYVDKNYEVEVGPAVIICTSNYPTEKAVSEAIGEALFSRFDAVIEFEDLNTDEVVEVVRRLFNARFAKLSPAEKAVIDEQSLRSNMMTRLASSRGNVRQLGKIIDEGISWLLVEAALTSADPALMEQPEADS